MGPLYHPRVLGRYLHDPLVYPFFLDCQNWKTRPVAYDMVISLSEFQAERQVPYDYQNTTVANLLSHFPADAQPELLIWWGFYGPIPVDIAESPIPTLLVVSDWHENLTSVLAYAEAFDFVLADQGLVDILQAKCLQHCAYWPSYALYPDIIGAHAGLPRLSASYPSLWGRFPTITHPSAAPPDLHRGALDLHA